MKTRDTEILRELAKQYRQACAHPVQAERRDLWRKHNSLEKTRPLIYVRALAWREMPQAQCLCEDPFYRKYESVLRYKLFWYDVDDDSVLEPWITMNAVKTCEGWGVRSQRLVPAEKWGAYKYDYVIKELDDVRKLRKPWHGIDEEQTREGLQKLEDAVGDIITVDCDRSPYNYNVTLTGDLGMLRGIEHLMLDMVDHPEWLHELVRFMADGVAEVFDQAVFYHNSGQHECALETYSRALKLSKKDQDHIYYAMAATELSMGNTEAALQNLETAIQMNQENRFFANNDPDFQILATDKKFQELIHPD